MDISFNQVVTVAVAFRYSLADRRRCRRPKPRSAEGDADQPSREGTPTRWPNVRVKPGTPPERWPRASSRPRWPDDAKTPFKTFGRGICPNRQAASSEGGCGTLTGEVKEGICPQGKGGTRARQSPTPSLAQPKPARNGGPLRSPCSDQKPRHQTPKRSTIRLRLRRRLNSSQPCALRRPFAHHCDSGSATRNTYPALPDRSRAHVYRCEASVSG